MPEADALEGALHEHVRTARARVIVFCSGKGGTGRTTLLAALAAALECAGLRVRRVDADAATAGLTHLLAADSSIPPGALETHEIFERAIRLAQDEASPGAAASGGDGRRGGVRAHLRALSDDERLDVILVDAAAGDGRETATLAAMADGLVLVTDASTMPMGQERRLMQALEAAWRVDGQAPAWSGLIVNRAPGNLDSVDPAAIAAWAGVRFHRVGSVGFDPDALAAGRLHESIDPEHAATRFADDVLRVFGEMLEAEQATWTAETRARWRELADDRTRARARLDAQRQLEAAAERKRHDRWPVLEEECLRLSAEIERLRTLRTLERQRQTRVVEELRHESRGLRQDLLAARDRAEGRRSYGLAALACGFAGGLALSVAAAVWLGPGATTDLASRHPVLAGLLGMHQPPAGIGTAPARSSARRGDGAGPRASSGSL